MRIAVGIFLIVAALPLTSLAHAEIFFPKVFSPAELPTTGFVLLNADPTIATVNLYFLSTAGTVLSAMPPVHIPPGGQFAKTGDELFPGMTADGWVYVLTDTEGMQAFWLTYDSAITFLDGAEAAQYETTGADQIIPLVTADTELSVISLQSLRTTLPVTVHLFGADSELAPAFQKDVATAGGFRAKAGDMFPASDFTQARYMRVTTPGAAIASTALIRGLQVSVEAAVINGINVGTTTEINFPHIVNGTLSASNYVTTIGVTNLSSASQTVTITFNPEAGDPIVATRAVSAHGALQETAGSLFGISTDFHTGWVRVTGTAPIAGFASYAETVGGGLAVVPAAIAQKNLFFLHIADGPPQWQTGMALLNATATPATVDVYALTPGGSLIGKTSITIDAGQKIAKVIHELIPETRGVNGGFIFVRSSNNVPLFGIELFYTQDLKVMSNVAAGKLVPGVLYVPPE
jgi:hypothetical protein